MPRSKYNISLYSTDLPAFTPHQHYNRIEFEQGTCNSKNLQHALNPTPEFLPAAGYDPN